MAQPNMLLLYVADVASSATFYANLLGHAPIEQSVNFAMLPLAQGVMLGLWARQDVQPAATLSGGNELIFAADSRAEVDTLHESWRGKGLPIVQAPTTMDFGYTFVALDLDGQRLRVMHASP